MHGYKYILWLCPTPRKKKSRGDVSSISVFDIFLLDATSAVNLYTANPEILHAGLNMASLLHPCFYGCDLYKHTSYKLTF
jgi:hypothetical protein